ncbi:hypothetical protein DIPPA_22076 [Diplonema papillatum]|nr:hypothetical protein DIPPA_22076 [Diplonema papillatum]
MSTMSSPEPFNPKSPARDPEPSSRGGSPPPGDPFAWNRDDMLALHDAILNSGRVKAARAASMPMIIRSGSITGGLQQALRGVTANHTAKEIGKAFSNCKLHSESRLRGLSIDGGSASCTDRLDQLSSRDMSPLHGAATEASLCNSPLPRLPALPPGSPHADGGDDGATETGDHDEISLLHLELQDREQQILQAVELGQGLLEQAEETRAELAAKEAEWEIETRNREQQFAAKLAELSKYRTTVMYLLNVEEELLAKSVENVTLQQEVAKLEKEGTNIDNMRWFEGVFRKDARALDEREKQQEVQEKDVAGKLAELNNWKARAARTNRVQTELGEALTQKSNLEAEVIRLKRLVHARDSSIYNLQTQLSDHQRLWKQQSTESALNRAKTSISLLRSALAEEKKKAHHCLVDNDDLRAHLAAERRQAKSLAAEVRRLLSADNPPPGKHDSETSRAVSALLAGLEGMKDECIGEFSALLAAITDVSHNTRKQGDVLRRLRHENMNLKAMLQNHLDEDRTALESPHRGRVLGTCQAINKELLYLKDYTRAVQGQVTLRQVTVKEVQEITSGLAAVYRTFHSLLHCLLSPSEKKQVGLSPMPASPTAADLDKNGGRRTRRPGKPA